MANLTGNRITNRLRRKSTRLNKYTGEIKPNTFGDPDYIPPVSSSPNCVDGSVLYYNTGQNDSATKNTCAFGFQGSSENLTSPANDFESTVSVADANAQAQDYVDNASQGHANTTGTCSLLDPAYEIGLSHIYASNFITFTLNIDRPTTEDFIVKIVVTGTGVGGAYYKIFYYELTAGSDEYELPEEFVGTITIASVCLADVYGTTKVYTNLTSC